MDYCYQCYYAQYSDLQQVVGLNASALFLHYFNHGKDEGRNMRCYRNHI